jgi:hypothetical protein
LYVGSVRAIKTAGSPVYRRRIAAVAKQPKGELVVVGFNYGVLEAKVAEKVRTSADRIREPANL